ncbi:MAG: acyl-CoA dehydrogenase [Planctomycetes bacterium]|nr:acyl-CoA dehydrogenase [Planctomycetota bacterium]
MNLILETYGAATALPPFAAAATVVVVFATLGHTGARLWLWTTTVTLSLWTLAAPWWLWPLLLGPLLAVTIAPFRRAVLSARVLRLLRNAGFLPQISDTERTAIAAGTVWLDGELFSGRPDLRRLASATFPDLTAEERAFVTGPCAQACALADDWQIHCQKDLSAELWSFLKEQRFFGMIIPREYGGLGLSASANSAVVTMLASRSLPLAITVMVPNSLGPAELLTHYGTEAQKQRWLPALASGAEIPCFALTEPGAGSDAGAISATGVVFAGTDGRLMLRLSWNKRYITLAAIATVLGLAIQLHDPENLLGKGPFPGITCALIPTGLAGVQLGRRHDPLGVPFYNCPTSGKDVVVALEDAIIGGAAGAGRGWQMLMECLAAGRGISLPATATGGAQLVARAVGAYAAVRQQFGMAIGKFEGIEEPLARIAGFTYVLEAARRLTCGGLDTGAKPAVVTAIAKYNATELWRKIINDGMDVLGGAAISRGPRNLLAQAYAGTPICITVEGANILTRTLMIFGQGAIRCHPFAFAELEAIGGNDVRAFDRAFWGHVGHVIRNGTRALLLGLTRGRLARSPVGGAAAPYWRRLSWASATFALWADVAMGTLGGNLKRKEKLTGRFADVFSWLYLGTATLRRFEADGRKPDDVAAMRWAMEYAFARMQEGMLGLMGNLELPGLTWLVRGPLRWLRRLNPLGSEPSDRLGSRLARSLLTPGSARERLTERIWVPGDPTSALGRLERALQLCADAEPIQKKLREAVKSGRLPKARPEHLLDPAVEAGILTENERRLLRDAESARAEAIAVDSFTLDEYLHAASPAQAAVSAPGRTATVATSHAGS